MHGCAGLRASATIAALLLLSTTPAVAGTGALTGKMAMYGDLLGRPWTCTLGSSTYSAAYSVGPSNTLHGHLYSNDSSEDEYLGYDAQRKRCAYERSARPTLSLEHCDDLRRSAPDIRVASVGEAQEESPAIAPLNAELRQRDEPLPIAHECEALILQASIPEQRDVKSGLCRSHPKRFR